MTTESDVTESDVEEASASESKLKRRIKAVEADLATLRVELRDVIAYHGTRHGPNAPAVPTDGTE